MLDADFSHEYCAVIPEPAKGNPAWLGEGWGQKDYSARLNDCIMRIIELVSPPKNCVEFGAWDGMFVSNTRRLLREDGWNGVMIEGDKVKYSALVENYRDFPNLQPVNAFVGLRKLGGGGGTIEEILDRSILADKPIGFMCIDIDGNDFHVWKSMEKYAPEIVMIEHNHCIPANIAYVQQADSSVSRGSSLSAIAILAEKKGYSLVAAAGPDAFFVKNEYFPRFGVFDNSVAALKSEEYATYIFQTYDGALHLAGYKKLHWLGQPISSEDIQALPKALRVFYDPGISGAIHEYIAGKKIEE